MYHYHILTREDNETIKKVYLNQKEGSLKGDWVQTLTKDFEFLKESQNDEDIIKMGKSEYSRQIKCKVEKAAFSLYVNHIRVHKKKMKNITNEKLKLQTYMNHPKFGQQEI